MNRLKSSKWRSQLFRLEIGGFVVVDLHRQVRKARGLSGQRQQLSVVESASGDSRNGRSALDGDFCRRGVAGWSRRAGALIVCMAMFAVFSLLMRQYCSGERPSIAAAGWSLLINMSVIGMQARSVILLLSAIVAYRCARFVQEKEAWPLRQFHGQCNAVI